MQISLWTRKIFESVQLYVLISDQYFKFRIYINTKHHLKIRYELVRCNKIIFLYHGGIIKQLSIKIGNVQQIELQPFGRRTKGFLFYAATTD